MFLNFAGFVIKDTSNFISHDLISEVERKFAS